MGTLLQVETEKNGKILHRWLCSPLDNIALILYGIIGKQFEQALDSKAAGGEKSADSNIMGASVRFVVVIPEFCFWATEHLPG